VEGRIFLNSRIEQSGGAGAAVDIAKYVVALVLVAAGVYAFYQFEGQWPNVARVLAVAGGLVAGIVVFLTTRRGGQTMGFLAEARFELRKVVWPKRQEATRTTWVVIAVVVAISLVLAFFDVIVQGAVKWLLAR
jgi:preprotein translocase subunit SecE